LAKCTNAASRKTIDPIKRRTVGHAVSNAVAATENREPAGIWQQRRITTFEISDRRRPALPRLIKLRLLPFMRRQKLKWRAAATRECPRTEHFAIRFRDNVIPPPPKRDQAGVGRGGRRAEGGEGGILGPPRDILMARESPDSLAGAPQNGARPPPPRPSPSRDSEVTDTISRN